VCQLYIYDSIGLREGGPTHQPIEASALCRATPNLLFFRPAGGNEISGSYAAISHSGPSVLALTRQNVPQLERSNAKLVFKGAYVVFQSDHSNIADLVIIATGSEVSLSIDAARPMTHLNTRIVSMPCDRLFDAQPVEYRRGIIPPGVLTVSIEALSVYGWDRYAHVHIGMRSFGASGTTEQVMKKFGLTIADVAEAIQSFSKQMSEELKQLRTSMPILSTHLSMTHVPNIIFISSFVMSVNNELAVGWYHYSFCIPFVCIVCRSVVVFILSSTFINEDSKT